MCIPPKIWKYCFLLEITQKECVTCLSIIFIAMIGLLNKISHLHFWKLKLALIIKMKEKKNRDGGGGQEIRSPPTKSSNLKIFSYVIKMYLKEISSKIIMPKCRGVTNYCIFIFFYLFTFILHIRIFNEIEITLDKAAAIIF